MRHIISLLAFTAIALLVIGLTSTADAFDQITLRKDPSYRRLIQLAEDATPEWMSERDIELLIRHRIRFIDVTEAHEQGLDTLAVPHHFPLPAGPRSQDEVKHYLKALNTELMKRVLTKFTSFRTRYYKSKSGLDSQRYLYRQVSEIASQAKASGAAKVTVNLFKHSWPQSSIIARFEGHGSSADETIVIGAHQDSVNMWLPSFGRAPGADDDGSGTVTILETFRVLVEGGFRPKRSVEFHWYAAEEAGLLGSQAVTTAYRRENRKIVAMLHNDMTGFVQDPEVIGIVTDYVDGELTGFLKQLVEEYTNVPWRELRCGYACSDHASWNKAGYRSAFPFETDSLEANPNVHSTRDTVGTIHFKHALKYARVAVGFAVELSKKAD